MEHFRVVVTEVTIYGRQRCVAGWDIDRRRTIRPEPSPGAFWDAINCGQRTTFHPGHLVTFNGSRPDTSLPHRTEDVVVEGRPWGEAVAENRFTEVLAQSLEASPTHVFREQLQFHGTSAHVAEGADCGSLAGMVLNRADLRLFSEERLEGPRLRGAFDLMGHRLNLSVAAKDMRQAFDNAGLQSVERSLAGANRLHLRLGLARALDHDHGERRCYLQINGIYPT